MSDKVKDQILFLRGGDVFDNREQFLAFVKNRTCNPFYKSRSWRDWIEWALSDDFEMMVPTWPNKQWADYEVWSLWFEKHFPFLNDQKLIVIAQSVGALFIIKYLSENVLPKRMDQLHIVSPMINNDGLIDERVGSFIIDPKLMPDIAAQADKLFIYASTDDTVVPFRQAEQCARLLPDAKFMAFNNRGHFNQPSFPELLEQINKNLD